MPYTPKPEDLIEPDFMEGQGEGQEGVEAELTAEAIQESATHAESLVEASRASAEITPEVAQQIAGLEGSFENSKVKKTESSLEVKDTDAPPEDQEVVQARAELEEYLGVDNPGSGLEGKLFYKELNNREEEKKSFKKFGYTSLGVGAVAGLSGLASSAAGVSGAAAISGGFGLVAVGGLFAAPAILAAGGVYWGGKKLWNKYKENKARKNADKAIFS